jgi:hypothetical protein
LKKIVNDTIAVSEINFDTLIEDIKKLKQSLAATSKGIALDGVNPDWNKEINAELSEDDDGVDMGEPLIETPEGLVHEVVFLRDGKECDADGNFITAFDEEEFDVDGKEVLL